MKRFLIILVILIILAGGGWFGYQQYLRPSEPRSLRDDPRVQPVPIGRETLVDTISASGSIEPEAEVEMKFETGGTVEEVLVKKGQYVTAGTVLALLDTADLELQVRSAEIDLTQAQANLEQLFEPELVEEIAAAQASVESARLNL